MHKRRAAQQGRSVLGNREQIKNTICELLTTLNPIKCCSLKNAVFDEHRTCANTSPSEKNMSSLLGIKFQSFLRLCISRHIPQTISQLPLLYWPRNQSRK